ncbi:MAG: oligoendopeptidase F, partial [Oscillospiraceae bacterium]|nr:oligoendopeptidase F [Oscillospiraceae bacterium]
MELLKRKDVPVEETWDLTLIYPNDDAMWAALERTKAAVRELVETYQGKLNTAENIVGCLDAQEKIAPEAIRIMSYSGLAQEVDYTDNEIRELNEKVGDETNRMFTDLSFIESEILLAPEEELEKAVG